MISFMEWTDRLWTVNVCGGRLKVDSLTHEEWHYRSMSIECVNSTSLSLCLCLHTEFSLCLCHSVYHHKWADAQFFMADAQFFGADAQFFRADAQFFAVGLLWPRNYAFCCCWTTFALQIMVLCHVYPLLSMCKLCLPLNWACANSVLGICRNNLHNLPCLWQFWLITMTQT